VSINSQIDSRQGTSRTNDALGSKGSNGIIIPTTSDAGNSFSVFHASQVHCMPSSSAPVSPIKGKNILNI
jgi:hypothetical protein